MKFNPTLHGIRGLAAVLVLIYHWQGTFPALAQAYQQVPFLGTHWNLFFLSGFGWIGVDWFFVMSGYVLAGTIWHQKLDGKALVGFWWRRVLRIFPAHWLQLICLLLFLYCVGLLTGFSWTRTWGNAVFWLRPLPGGVQSYNSVTWTLVLELSFYLVLPFVVMAYRRVGLWPVISFVLIWQLLSRFGIPVSLTGEPLGQLLKTVQLLLPGIQLVFMMGVALNHWPRLESARDRRLMLAGLVIVYLLLLWGMGLYHDEVSRWHWSVFVWRLAMAVVIAGLLWCLLDPLRGFGWLSARPLVWLGEISYGVYLWHFPVQRLMPKLLPGFWDTPWMSFMALLVSFGLTLLLASASYYWVEQPLISRFSGKSRQDSRANGAPASTVV